MVKFCLIIVEDMYLIYFWFRNMFFGKYNSCYNEKRFNINNSSCSFCD